MVGMNDPQQPTDKRPDQAGFKKWISPAGAEITGWSLIVIGLWMIWGPLAVLGCGGMLLFLAANWGVFFDEDTNDK